MKNLVISKLRLTAIPFTALALFIFGLTINLSECKGIACLDASFLDKYKLEEVYEDEKDTYRALYKDNDRLIRLDMRSGISKSEASKRIEAQVTKMKALFENAVSPYPGMISDEIECSKEFKPIYTEKQFKDLDFFTFEGYLNQRLNFGACTEDQASYKGIMILFYCENENKLFSVEVIRPREDKENSLGDIYTINCREEKVLKIPFLN